VINEFVSLNEVARRCKLARMTVMHKLKTGAIPGRILHHGTFRVCRKTFEEWLASQGSVQTG
jgi:hypothetical protein